MNVCECDRDYKRLNIENFLLKYPLSLELWRQVPDTTIDKPTRVYDSATLTDNIFVNNTDNKIISGNMISDVSDHLSQFCIVSFKNRRVQYDHAQNLTRDYSNFSDTKFNNHLVNLISLLLC